MTIFHTLRPQSLIPSDLRELIDARKAEMPPRCFDAPATEPTDLLTGAQWTPEGLARPAEWRTAVEQSRPGKPTKRPMVFARRKTSPPKPRQKRTYTPHPGHHRNEEVTAYAILEGYRAGKTAEQMMAEWGCSHALLCKRQNEARATDPEYRRLETELRTCACGRPKRQGMPKCRFCSPGNGPDRRVDITIPAIIAEILSNHTYAEMTQRLQCSVTALVARIKAAKQDPVYGPILRALATCAECGGRKYMYTESTLCAKCQQKGREE